MKSLAAFCFTLLAVLGMDGNAFGQTATEYVEGDVIVTFKAGATLDQAKGVLKGRAMSFTKRFDRLSARRGKQMGLVRDGAKTTAQLIADLKADAKVESVEPNYLRWVRAVPNDTRFAEMWALRNTGQAVDGVTGTSGADIQYVAAHAMARPAAAEVVVGIIDTGVDYLHPDLAANIWTNPLEIAGNSIDDDSNGYVDDVRGYDFASGDANPADSGDHGTHVAGTVAAVGDNNSGVIGVNDKAKLLPLKVSTNGTSITTSAVLDALEYATALKTRGVNIVALNGSYGGGGYSAAESAAIQAAGDAGIVFCVAAGNETTNNDSTPTYPASYHLANMIVVAATDQKDALASYSNYGATSVDIAAPGTNILSTEPSTLSFQAGGVTYSATALTFSGTTTGLTGTLVDCGIGNTGDFPSSVSGNIALIQRGTLTFSTKVTNAMAAGAIAAIIYNNVPGNFSGTLQTAGGWIPAYSISQADGATIKAGLPMTGGLVMTETYQFLDGTSMATPHVAGAVALAAMNHPDETVAARRQRILNSATAKTGLAGKVATGGRLNLLRVVDSDANNIADWQDELIAQTPVMITTSPLPLAVVGTAYSLTLVSEHGTSPYTYTVDVADLPDGLSLSEDGILAGTPEAAGSYSFDITVLDDVGHSSTSSFTVSVVTKPAISTTSPLPQGIVGTEYAQAFTVNGGTAPYEWSISSGELPPGLSLGTDGALSGLPLEAGSFAFTVVVQDAHELSAQMVIEIEVIESPITITSAQGLPYGVKGAAYAAALHASGGTEPYTWSLKSGALPAGLTLNAAGQITGTPTAAGSFAFTAQIEDDEAITSARLFTLEISSTYVAPVVNTDTLGSVMIGVPYSHTFTATNYPKSFSITGLPSGLKYVAATGVVSGRPLAAGTFPIKVKAINPGGSSVIVTMPLEVEARPTGTVGTFMGLVARDAAANAGLGSRLSLTTTGTGYYTVKVTTGASTRSAVGYLEASAPQLTIPLGTSLLSLTLDATANSISGTHGAAAVTGWRSVWNAKTNPATSRAGYYSVGLDLADVADQGVESIPQGSGFATFSVTTAGTLTVSGRTADGQVITTAGFVGQDGQIAVHTSLYAHLGSITGNLTLTGDTGSGLQENTASGTLTWLKPTNTSRTYGTTFGPLNLSVFGKYLAPNRTSLVLGLPAAGTAALTFSDGGLHLSAVDPDVSAFTYGSNYAVTMPTFASGGNPAKATLSINRNTGAVSGTFTLVETVPALTRKVAFVGQIVRPASGSRRAAGYFLLPQIPLSGQTIRTSPILSGGMQVSQ